MKLLQRKLFVYSAVGSTVVLCTALFLLQVHVFAQSENPVAPLALNVFPTSVSGDGFDNVSAVSVQNVTADARAHDFNRDNSAYILSVVQDESEGATSQPQQDTKSPSESVPVESNTTTDTHSVGGGESVPVPDPQENESPIVPDILPTESPRIPLESVLPQSEIEVVPEIVPEVDVTPEQSIPSPATGGDAVVSSFHWPSVVDWFTPPIARAQDIVSEDSGVSSTPITLPGLFIGNVEIPAVDTKSEEDSLPGEHIGPALNEEPLIVPLEETTTLTENGTTTETTVSGTTSVDIIQAPAVPVVQAQCLQSSSSCNRRTMTLTGFGLGDAFATTTILNAQLRLSLANIPKSNARDSGDALKIEYRYHGEWVLGGELSLQNALSNSDNGGYFLFALPVFASSTDLARLAVRVTHLSDGKRPASDVFIDSAWVELSLSSTLHQGQQNKILVERRSVERTGLRTAKINEMRGRLDFSVGEDPRFSMRYISQRSAFVQFLRSIFADKEFELSDLKLYGPVHNEVPATFEASYVSDGEWTLSVHPKGDHFRPGRYSVKMQIAEGSKQFSDEFDFYWGVLALNPNKASYVSDEVVNIDVAVLSEMGNTVCDATVRLSIVDPSGAMSEVPVVPSGVCVGDNFTTVPDYSARYRAGAVGKYLVRLERLTSDGVLMYEISDSFSVVEKRSFDVERIGPTRINPLYEYDMKVRTVAHEQVVGSFFETVAPGFVVTAPGASTSVLADGSTQIVWPYEVAAGETREFTYTFDAPQITPYVFRVGPASVATSSNEMVAVENRQWQIASDAEVAIDTSLTNVDGSALNSSPTVVFVSDQVGYAFYVDNGDVCSYRKTTNGATSWGATVQVDSVNGADCIRIAVWYDQWTPGDRTGTKIHIATIDSGADDVYYTELDTSSDTLSTTVLATTQGATLQAATNLHSITKGTDGVLYMAVNDAGDSWIVSCSTGCTTATNWAEITNPYDADNDWPLLMPLPSGAIMSLRMDISGNDYDYNVWDGASWSGWNTIVSTATTTGENGTYLGHFGATVNRQTNDIYFVGVVNNGIALGTDDGIRTAVYHNGSWTAKTDVLTNDTKGLTNAKISLDENTGDLYAVYSGRTTPGTANTGNVYYKRSTDGMGSWGAQTQVNVGADDIYGGGNVNIMSNERIYATWKRVVTVTDDLYGNTVADLTPLAVFDQSYYRWYVNDPASTTPSDPWPLGETSDLAEDTDIGVTEAVSPGDVLRLRMSLDTNIATATVGTFAFKLQYATGTVCSALTNWFDVGSTSSSTPWRGYDNASFADGTALASTSYVLLNSDVAESYEEQNNSTGTPKLIAPGQTGEWDWVLENNGATAGESYCFRMVRSTGAELYTYLEYPLLLTDASPDPAILITPFDNEKFASTSPNFTFSSSDPNGDAIEYEIQVDDDALFASPVIDLDSVETPDSFKNFDDYNGKAPFTSGNAVGYSATSTLSNNTTYWWRVRGKDTGGSGAWGSWSTPQSFTNLLGVGTSTWFQTTQEQFQTDTLTNVQANSGGTVTMTGSSPGTLVSSVIHFDSGVLGNAWGTLSWTDTEPGTTDIKYHLEYFTSTSSWNYIPDSDLPGNAVGFDDGPINLLDLNTETYNQIRIKADFTYNAGSPTLSDWTVVWGYRVVPPTLYTPFDNEKVATTTPQFEFVSTDPDGQSLTYEVQWSTSSTFSTNVVSRISSTSPGFSNTVLGGDTNPFNSGERIQLWTQASDAMASGTTYWWRVRAKDPPPGSDTFSLWSDYHSFTIATNTIVSTWYQTTREQFETNELTGVEGYGSGGITVSTTSREAFIAYGEVANQSPRFRLWDGSVWGSEESAGTINSAPNWVVTKADPKSREEYIIGTLGANGDVTVQVRTGDNVANSFTVTDKVYNLGARGFDIAYEQSSGDAMVVTCDGDADPVYSIWDGTVWSATSTIDLTSAGACEWIKLASDPVSDEIILVSKNVGTAYQMKVWNGSAWDVAAAVTMGSMAETTHEGIAVEYENSGNQAVVVVSDGANPDFAWNSWNGSAWSGATTFAIDDDFEWGSLKRAAQGTTTSDNMALCFIDQDSDVGLSQWNGTTNSWTNLAAATTIIEADSMKTSRPVDCEYESTAGRLGNIMVAYSSTTGNSPRSVGYRVWSATSSSIQAEGSLAINPSPVIQLRRTGDGKILLLAFDRVNTQYDFSYWNGSVWSTVQTLETSPSVSPTPYREPFMMSLRPRNSVGSLYSTPIDFDDGTGPLWQEMSWNHSTPGGSSLLYRVEYYNTASSSWDIVPDGAFTPARTNSLGTSTSPMTIRSLDTTTYNRIRYRANLTCDTSYNCPIINDWTVKWAEGLTVSGTAKKFDESTNVTAGTTVAVAVNGSLKVGKTGTVDASGNWSIANVTVFPGDTVTVWLSGVADNLEGVAVTKYDGEGEVTGLKLYEQHLSIGADDATTITNANLGLYDNSVSGNEDIFYDVNASNDLSVCNTSGCYGTKLIINSGNTFRPDSASSGNASTTDLRIDGILYADGNTIRVGGTWDNNQAFDAGSSTVILTATSSVKTIDSTGSATSTFYHLTFGESTGFAEWNLSSPLVISGNTSINYGTTSPGVQNITMYGNLAIGANGAFSKGYATTTFAGSGTATWTDSTSAKQDLGIVVIDGTAKSVQLLSSVKATNVSIGSDDTLNAGGANTITVSGSWFNNNQATNSFNAQTGTVAFSTTTSGRIIQASNSDFYNLSFSGSGGGWAFTGTNATTTGDVAISGGTVTLPTGTFAVAGSFQNTGGAFTAGAGTIKLTSATSGKYVRAGGSTFTNLWFSGSGGWTLLDAYATSTGNVEVSGGTLTTNPIIFAVGGNFQDTGGAITSGTSTVRLYSATTGKVLQFGGSSLSNIIMDGAGSWTIPDVDATTTGNFVIFQGSTTLPSATLAIGGSLGNTGTMNANGGTVIFNATTTNKTINPGNSLFKNVIFNGSAGGWTISANATTTGYFRLVSASLFTLSPSRTLEVQGVFTNGVGSTQTTWTNSTLHLSSGATTTDINTKTDFGDMYGTLRLSSTTGARMWNSSSTVYQISSPSSLYSMNHASTSGSLYIFGAYTRTTGNDYWSYAKDFDGTVLSGSARRAVDVRFASNSTTTFSGGGIEILGDATATTTLRNQGSGTYALLVSGASTTMQYYQVRNAGARGLEFSGSPVINGLSNGDFELSVAGGSAMTVASTTISANPLLDILSSRFATTTVIAGYNVTETGIATSYWRFRSHYGNLAGEDSDNDAGGNPGYIRWDNSGFSVTVAGIVYANDGLTPLGAPTCDGATSSVRIKVNGGGNFATSCNATTGAYSTVVTYSGDVSMIAFLDTGNGVRGATVTKSPTGNVSNFDIYQNRVIVRHEDVTPLTIADMVWYDSSDDGDIPFTAVDSSPDTLLLPATTELHVWANKTFTPSGNVTITGGSAQSFDGTLHLGTSSAFIASGFESHTIGGNLTLITGSTLTTASSTFTFTATSTGHSVAPLSYSFWNLTFNGSGGGWVLATTTILNDMVMTAGTATGTSPVEVRGGDVTGNGTIALTGSTFTVKGTGSFGGDGAWSFANLTFGSTSLSATTTRSGVGTTTVAGILTVVSGHELKAGASVWNLSGGGTPFVTNGTFTPETSTILYSATTATAISSGSYYNLELSPAGVGGPTYTFASSPFTVGNNLTVGNGTHAGTSTISTSNPAVTVVGNVLIRASSTLVASASATLTVGGNWHNSGLFTSSGGTVLLNAGATGRTIDAGVSSFGNLTINSASGGFTIAQNATTTGAFTLTSAQDFTLATGKTLAVGGVFTNSVGGGATDWTGSILSLVSGATSSPMNTKSVFGDTYGTLRVSSVTHARMWNSSASSYDVASTSSLYSMNHASTSGSLYLFGSYARVSGSDYWSYAKDFDGTTLVGGARRSVDVHIQSNGTTTYSGGGLEILGAVGATTTIANQGSGTYGFTISGASTTAQYFQFRNLGARGLEFSGSPVVNLLSNGDLETTISGGTMMTVAPSVITQNPFTIVSSMRFATTSPLGTVYNVTEIGFPVGSWRMTGAYGNLAGESFDNDSGGNPGYIVWDDSAIDIQIGGNVYSDEGVTPFVSVCDGSSKIVHIRVENGTSTTTHCNPDGSYIFPGIIYSTGDTIIVYLDTNGGERSATMTVDPQQTNISNMDLYRNRVIVRHEDTSPITITDLAKYDSSDDSDIPFTATVGTPDTLSLPAHIELHVWNNKSFAPGGNSTLVGGGSADTYDGSLHVGTGGSFIASNDEYLSVGGSFTLDSSAVFTSASSTILFTATTTGKTITVNSSPLSFVAFTGVSGGWTFSGAHATATGNVVIANGSVTLPSGTLALGDSFLNTGGTFVAGGGTAKFIATSGSKTIRAGGSSFANLWIAGSGGSWVLSDVNATTTYNTTISAGTLALPSGVYATAGSFTNSGGTVTAGSGTVRSFATTTGKTMTFGGSSLSHMVIDGAGSLLITDQNATTTGDVIVYQGSTTLPAGNFAVGGSFINNGTVNANGGTVSFTASATGKTITPGSSSFANVIFNSTTGGWTIVGNATTTGNFTLANASSFTLNPTRTLEVKGTFTNSVGGTQTTWDNATLHLSSGATTTNMNAKNNLGDLYGTLRISSTTQARMWNSSSTVYQISSPSSLYSMNHASTSGSLYVFGTYTRSLGSDYWSYAKDFDGTVLSGSARRVVDVRFASNSTTTFSGGSIEILGDATATTTLRNQGSGTYALVVSGGTFNAGYYSLRNIGSRGLEFTGTPSITPSSSSLSNGDFELSVNGGSMMTVASTTISANPSVRISGTQFSTSSGITTGYNVTSVGSTTNAWILTGHRGNYDGENYDNDGYDACGAVRWDDSTCLFVDQSHYRFRNDDGGEGVPTNLWYDSNWGKRRKITITNNGTTTLTNYATRLSVDYDATDMQSDFDDLRFTDSTGTSTIPFYIESYTAASSTVWVKVPSIPGSGSANIYMYYKNNSVVTTGSGTTTFATFDDFEDGGIIEYGGNTTMFEVTAGDLYHGSYGLGVPTGSETSQTTDGIFNVYATTTRGQTLRFYQYVNTTVPANDEPCMLFAVGNPGADNLNYAVCLKVYGTDQLIIAKDVSSNAPVGKQLVAKTVTYSAGWYEVIIDWLAGGKIDVALYNATSNTLVATTTATDTTYASGGVGFSYWTQHGSWDFLSVRPYATTTPSYSIDVEQGGGGATWRAAEDTPLTNVSTGEIIRTRFSIKDSGDPITDGVFELQLAEKGAYGSCKSVPYNLFSDVPLSASVECASSPLCMATSSSVVNYASTTELLSSPGNDFTFTQGQFVEDPSNGTQAITIGTNEFTEVEYAVSLTQNAIEPSYCLRVVNAGVALDNYSNVAEVQLLFPPSLTNLSLNGGSFIALTEGTSTFIMATGTVTDYNGVADITSATATIYRLGVGPDCVADDNNCYQATAAMCPLEAGCTGNSCTILCSVPMKYFADPTEGGTYDGEDWRVRMSVYDSTNQSDIATSLGSELTIVSAIGVTGNLEYGTLDVGTDTGTRMATTTVRNVGNAVVNLNLFGTDLVATGSAIPAEKQKYSTTTFNYACPTCSTSLATTSQYFGVGIPKPTTTTPVTEDVYWGLAVPINTAGVPHEGSNTFMATQ
jgi:lipopolysaccharide export system protein LptA